MDILPEEADLLARYHAVRHRLAQAVADAGRSPGEVSLVAVGKTHGAARMLPLLAAGQRLFGENRVQEAEVKWPALKADYPDVELHLIGPLQTNKVRQAVALFDVIQTVDRPKLAAALAAEFARSGRRPDCLVEVNIAGEPQKAGVPPDQADHFIEECRTLWALPIVGLMCIPPGDDDPAPHFRRLAELARQHGLSRLSMGMSDDYPAAVAAGASWVRVGTAIFGARPTS